MDKKLEEYRKQKQREEIIEKTKNTLSALPSKLYNGFGLRAVNKGHHNNSNSNYEEHETNEYNEPLLPASSSVDKLSDDEDLVPEHRILSDAEIDNINCCTTTTLFKYLFIFIIWATCFYIFILWQFGTVFFICSLLIGMYFNTGTRRKQKGERSAYSVFNRNCESIHGTVKAEDLEKQMIYGRLF